MKHPAGFALGDWSEVKNIGFKSKPGSDITKLVLANFGWKAPERKTPEPGKDGKAYLTSEMASSCESFWRVLNNKGVEGKAISVGDKRYERGLGVHAPSQISFSLKGKFAVFHVVPGPDDAHNGLLEMKILVDGKEVFATGKVSSREFNAKDVMIPVTGANELTLVVMDGGNGKGGDHASWADAYLRLAE
ncbi:MAG: NPCBM/NEW2 domain-containing protein [Kiritimatiellae bacterium]|nr:NPCBM/NEW2 domain-containing protein [Kiritimatiellia bacterium]